MTSTIGKKCLVTGGGGFLGKAIVQRLIGRGDKVRSFSRKFYPDLKEMGVEQVPGDLSDARSVIKAVTGMDTVYHVAAKPGVWGKYADFYRTNAQGTNNIIDACRCSRVSAFVHTSSPSVVFDGSSMEGVDESAPYPASYCAHYPRTKAMAEQAVVSAARNGLPAIILRPHLIWGPGDNHLVPRILARANKLRQVGGGENRVDTIYIDNAAEAHINAEEALRNTPALSGNIYFISQDDPIRLWDMVNRILAAGGYPQITGTVSTRAAWVAGALLELIYKTLGIRGEPIMTRFVAKELATSHWFDISAAKRDLGYRPKISTAEGLERLSGWLKEKGLIYHYE
ncbi:MAG: NAD-dependent epimerase/dehydratase family protein [Desulfobacteraceae bacterium]|nr:NAD-dependent epimerase/dehydratase family protein [Desulfobacteraceae bacterium]